MYFISRGVELHATTKRCRCDLKIYLVTVCDCTLERGERGGENEGETEGKGREGVTETVRGRRREEGGGGRDSWGGKEGSRDRGGGREEGE